MRLDCTVEEGYRELADEARELPCESSAILEREMVRVEEEEPDDPPAQKALRVRKKKHCSAVIRWMGDLSRLKTRELIEK